MGKDIKQKKAKALLTGADLSAIGDLMGGLMDKQAAILASKKDLQELKEATKQDLAGVKDYISQGFESVTAGVDAIAEKLTEKVKFENLIEWAKEVGEKVGVKPRV